ncbi:MAG: rhomboid family intramembrane serine protease [Deltaproteobacteria bacterium]|nr:rhomboid family intramembrane serine protease [Deltaproteobacteria bacterium]
MPPEARQDPPPGAPPPRHLSLTERARLGPVTTAVALFCAGLFLAGNLQPELFERGVMAPDEVWGGELWRLLTANFFHVNFLHVAFNVLWWWTLAFAIEVRFGGARLLLLTLATGVAGSLAELAFVALDYPGSVGLSGAVYGLFCFGYVALRPLGGPFGMLFGVKNAQVFLGWGLLCVVLTVADVLPVANYAHGAGALFGALLGWAWSQHGLRRLAFSGAFAALLALLAFGGLNPRWTSRHQAFLGSRAFDAKDWPAAATHFEAVLERHPDAHWIRANLALVLAQAGRLPEATAAARALPESYLATLQGGNQQIIAWLRSGELEAHPEGRSGVGSPP